MIRTPLITFLASIVLTVALPATTTAQQRIEVTPYAGGFWPTETLGGEDFKNDGLYGVRASGFVTERLMVGGNIGYSDEFEYAENDPVSRAWLWDVNASWHFFPWDINLAPFVTAGLGGLTATIEEDGSIFFLYEDDGGFLEIGDPEPGVRVVELEDNDTFFGFTYGGGLRAVEIWEPVGLRFDLRGRTLPNFFGTDLSWLESTGGVTIALGGES